MIAQKHNQIGISLLEVLVSLFLISLILLGFDAVQITLLKQMKNSFYYAVADLQINNWLERHNAEGESYGIAEWNKENKLLLPNGIGNVLCERDYCEIKIAWLNAQGKNVFISTHESKL